jgi:hypothetical protein
MTNYILIVFNITSMVKGFLLATEGYGLENRRRASHLLKPVKPVTMRVLLNILFVPHL